MGDNLDSQLIALFFYIFRQTLGIGGFIIDNVDGFSFEVVFDECSGDLGLVVIPAAHAEHVRQTALGDFFIGGSRCQHRDIFFCQGLGSRDSGR